MGSRRGSIRWPERLAAITMALMTVAVGFCLVDGDHVGQGHHMASLDLCTGLLSASSGMGLLGLAEVARLSPAPRRGRYTTSPHLLDPPPKTLALLA